LGGWWMELSGKTRQWIPKISFTKAD